MRISDGSSDVCSSDLLCSFADLPPDARAPDVADYAERRDAPPSAYQPIQWCLAKDIPTGRDHFLPHPLVSLDWTWGHDSLFDRESSGLGAGSDEGAALRVSLLEIIERDALGEWRRGEFESQMARSEERRVGNECGRTGRS